MNETFTTLGLSPLLLKALKQLDFQAPYPIQQESIPPVLQGKDVCVSYPTGSGKTAAYLLPLLQKATELPRSRANRPAYLILCPTRELAAQIFDNLKLFSEFTKIRSAVACGGVSINPQMIRLSKGVEILVATPGRLLDLYRKKAVHFENLQTLVLDEADKMLNLGFQEEIEEILSLLPEKRQNLLFSATYPDGLNQLADRFMHQPLLIGLEGQEEVPPSIEEWVFVLDKPNKPLFMVRYLRANPEQKVLVFCKTQNGANRLVRRLTEYGIDSTAIHGGKSQGARQNVLDDFRSGRKRILVATDLAARGLDIENLPLVVNYDLPHLKEDYIHRIGRTGRAGEKGQAFSLVCADEHKPLVDIERYLQRHLERRIPEGFPLKEELRPSPRVLRPHKPKKPKKNKNKD